MEKEWQICELEDGSKSFIEFTVSAVPDIWIFERHGTMWCYWPKTSALKKIKSFEQPQTSRNWTTYKCRILMNEGMGISLFPPTLRFMSLAQLSMTLTYND